MRAEEEAYAVAERLIDEAIAKGAEELDLDTPETLDLTHLPPRISAATQLNLLDLRNTQVSDFNPIKTLTALRTLDLRNTQVSDLDPIKTLTASRGSISTTPKSPICVLSGG